MRPDFHKTSLIYIKFGKCGFGHWRLANASQIFLGWITLTVRRSWLPQAAYEMGWNAAWRQFHRPRYWQHDETGRVCANDSRPSERWYEITEGQYDSVRDALKNVDARPV